MSGAIVIAAVLGIIFIARKKMGDATYDQIVISAFKWLFIFSAAVLACLYIYSHYLR